MSLSISGGSESITEFPITSYIVVITGVLSRRGLQMGVGETTSWGRNGSDRIGHLLEARFSCGRPFRARRDHREPSAKQGWRSEVL